MELGYSRDDLRLLQGTIQTIQLPALQRLGQTTVRRSSEPLDFIPLPLKPEQSSSLEPGDMASDAEADLGILELSAALNCGCQELISSSLVSHYGWLRKRSMRNKLLKLFSWPRVYVVIAEKNLYYFQNETSRKPAGSVSLYGFNRIVRANENKQREAIWAFKMEHVQRDIPSLYFAATSEKEMMKWMRLIKKEMLVANGKEDRTTVESQYGGSMSDQSCSSSDYNFIEASVYEEPLGPDAARRESRINATDDFSDDGAYNDFEVQPPENPSVQTSPSQTPPSLPPSDSGYSLEKKSSPQASVEDEYWASVHFKGNKIAATEMISKIADSGVYLVRKSDDGSNVLVVYTTATKKYKIEEKEKGSFTLSLLNGPFFSSLEELLYYYYANPLPGTEHKLIIPYQHHSSYRP